MGEGVIVLNQMERISCRMSFTDSHRLSLLTRELHTVRGKAPFAALSSQGVWFHAHILTPLRFVPTNPPYPAPSLEIHYDAIKRMKYSLLQWTRENISV